MPLSPEEFEELTESFDYNDSDDDWLIEFHEFVNMLNALEANVGPEEARIGFSADSTFKRPIAGERRRALKQPGRGRVLEKGPPVAKGQTKRGNAADEEIGTAGQCLLHVRRA